MSTLIVLGFEDAQSAENAYQRTLELQRDYIISLTGLAIVHVDQDGKTHVDTPRRIVASSAATGALWGMLLGLLFFVPGMILFGGAMGALMGKLSKSGIDQTFRGQVQDMLAPGHSAVVIMASQVTEDKFAAALQPFGGTLLKTSLSEADEADLAKELVADA